MCQRADTVGIRTRMKCWEREIFKGLGRIPAAGWLDMQMGSGTTSDCIREQRWAAHSRDGVNFRRTPSHAAIR